MCSYGGANPSRKDGLFTVGGVIRLFAEDIGLSYSTVRDYRWMVAEEAPADGRLAHDLQDPGWYPGAC